DQAWQIKLAVVTLRLEDISAKVSAHIRKKPRGSGFLRSSGALFPAVSVPQVFFGGQRDALAAGDHGLDQVVMMQQAFGHRPRCVVRPEAARSTRRSGAPAWRSASC